MNAATSRSRRDDIILSENAKEYQRKKLIAFDYFRKIYGNPDLLPDTVKAYENVFKLDVPEKILSSLYVNYADLLSTLHAYGVAVSFRSKKEKNIIMKINNL